MGFLPIATFASLVLFVCVLVMQQQDMQWALLDSEKTDLLGESHLPLFSAAPLLFGLCRALFALIIWAVTLYLVLDPAGLVITIMASPSRDSPPSKSHNTTSGDTTSSSSTTTSSSSSSSPTGAVKSRVQRTVLLKGFDRLTMFTVWSWILQGLYFTLSSYASISAHYRYDGLPMLPSSLQRLAWVLFEISFPVSFLVSMVVSFVLIPGCKKEKVPVTLFFQPLALIMHNANIYFMAFEFVVNQLPFVAWHIVFMLFYGLAYVLFSWYWHSTRGYYYYFFLDYNRKDSLLWYVGLVLGLSLLFLAGYGCSHLQYNYTHLVPNVIVGILTFMSTKLRDQ